MLSAAHFLVRCPYLISPFFGRHGFLLRFMLLSPYEMSRDFLTRFHAFGFVMRFPYESFCVLLDNFLVRFHAFLPL
jgi:hypothetical protein